VNDHDVVGMASCASARLAGVVPVAASPLAPVEAVCAASEDMKGVSCAGRCGVGTLWLVELSSRALPPSEGTSERVDTGVLRCVLRI
jgi:hypothetical protein